MDPDVTYTVTEEPEPLSERSRLRRRVAAVLTAATVAFGGMAAAADALTETGKTAGQQAKPSTVEGSPWKHDKPCRKGDRDRRGSSSSALRY